MIILGGNSESNKQWIIDIASQATQQGSDAYAHMYQHWEDGNPFIDINHELQVLQQLGLQEPYVIIAKSMGSILAIKGMYEGILHLLGTKS